MIRVKNIFRYPVKSMQGQAIDSAMLTPDGIGGDRQFVVVDTRGKCVTARTEPKLLTLKAFKNSLGLRLESADGQTCSAFLPDERASLVPVAIWDDRAVGADMGDAIATWLSNIVQKPVRLLAITSKSNRAGVFPGTPISFADGAPLLLFSEASLSDINARLETPMSVRNFRPNLLLEGVEEAFAEDTWARIKIGDIYMDVSWGCSRCVLTTLDPETGVKHPQQEPLRTLTKYRQGPDKRVYFGQNVIPLNGGVITVGDSVEIVGVKDNPTYLEDVRTP